EPRRSCCRTAVSMREASCARFCSAGRAVLPAWSVRPKLDRVSQHLDSAMKLKEKTPATEIADVQSSPDSRQLQIDQVGIKDIRHPVRVKDKSQGEQHTIATFNMYVELPHNF